jgi:hypothetical protein
VSNLNAAAVNTIAQTASRVFAGPFDAQKGRGHVYDSTANDKPAQQHHADVVWSGSHHRETSKCGMAAIHRSTDWHRRWRYPPTYSFFLVGVSG